MTTRVLTVQVGWVWIGLAVLVLAAVIVLALRPTEPEIDPARIRAACQEYVAWELAGWASICADAGFQPVPTTPEATPTSFVWPTAVRTLNGTTTVVQPEDICRTPGDWTC